MGPDYRPATEKPTATVSTQVSHDNIHILSQTPQLIALLTCVRPYISNAMTVTFDTRVQYDQR